MPAVLKFSRDKINKEDADIVVAGLLTVLAAKSFHQLLSIFKAWIKIHCSNTVDQEARKRLNAYEKYF